MRTENYTAQSLNMLLSDPKLSEFITAQIDSMTAEREAARSASPKPEKVKFQRIAYDTLLEINMLTAEAMIDEFRWILIKESDLPSREREFVRSVLTTAMLQTVAFYEQSAKAEEQAKLKAEKSAKRKTQRASKKQNPS